MLLTMDRIEKIKNIIYQNIYNNLAYIQKSKGTFKSLRNFLRCFGIDEELIKLNISPETMKENKEIVEDLIIAAHSDAKLKLKSKTSEELSKITGGVALPPGFKWPF